MNKILKFTYYRLLEQNQRLRIRTVIGISIAIEMQITCKRIVFHILSMNKDNNSAFEFPNWRCEFIKLFYTPSSFNAIIGFVMDRS